MSSFDAGKIEASLVLRKDEFDRVLDQAKADAAKFSGKSIGVKVKAETTAADKGLTGTQAKADKLGKSTPTVKVGVSNDSANRQLDDTQAKADRLGKTSVGVKVNAKDAKDAGSWMATLVGAATAVAPAMVVAGVGVAAFGALAVPTITKVVKAQHDMATGAKGAAVEYANLSASQKTMVAGITQLEGSYKRLSVAVQPQVLQVFNEVLATADTILPHLVPLAQAGGNAVAYLVRTLGSVATDPQARQFGHFLGQEIGPDMQAIAGLLPPVIHLFESLVQDLNPLAVATLHFASGLVGVVNSLTRAAPWLTDTAAAALVLYKPVAAIIGLDIGAKFAAMAAGVGKLKDAFAVAQAAATVDKALAASQAELAVATAGFAVAADGTTVALTELTVAEEAAAVGGAALGAVNPLVWVGLALAAVAGLAVGLSKLASGSKAYYQQVILENQGTGFAVASYNAAAAAIGKYNDQQGKTVATMVNLHTGAQAGTNAVGGLAGATQQLTAAQERQVTAGRNINAYLTDLQNRYHVTREQAIAFATGAGVTADEVAKGGDAAQQAAQKTQTYVDAMIAAAGTGRTLQVNLDVLAAKTDTTTTAVQQLNSAWDAFLGIGTGLQSAFLTLEGNLAGIDKAAQAAGASMGGTNTQSQALQQAFQQGLSGVAGYADAMRTAGTNQGTFNANMRLALAPLAQYAQHNSAATAQLVLLARAAGYTGPESLKALQAWLGSSKGAMDRLKGSTDQQTAAASRLTDASAKTARTLQSSFITQVAAAGLKASASVTDVNRLSRAIENTGTKSGATAGARAQLIADLKKSGVNAQTAAGLVDGFIRKLGQIPATKTVNLKESASGTWSLSEINASTGKQKQAAAGWYVSGGTPGKDSVPLLAMPGELVVPTKMVNAGAVDHLRGQIPGFAAGGLVGGSYAGTPPGLGQWSVNEYNASVAALAKQLETTAGHAARAAKSAASAAAVSGGGQGGGVAGPGGGAPAANAALARKLMPAWGSGAEWAAWNQLEMMEAGWNQFARNPSSGAYGIPQALPPSKMGAAANPPQSNPTAQIRWMVGYIQGRYGDPIRALAHENANHWYARGTGGAAPGWAVTGEQGRELVLMRGGETVLPHAATEQVLAMHRGGTIPGYAAGAIPAAMRKRTSGGSDALAGIIAGAPKEGWAKDVTSLKSDLRIIATTLGIRGLSRKDASRLRSEQGKDETELLVATAYLKVLTGARKQIMTVTEPQLRKQISALTGLGKIGKLSASENRLLKTLKASLAAQQAKLGRIDTAIYGKKAAVKPKPAGPPAGDGGTGGGGGSVGGGTPQGQFVGILPGPPGSGPPDITGGGTGGLGGNGSTILGITGFPAAAGYGITPQAGAGGQQGGGGWDGMGGGQNIESLLAQILSATRAAPAATGGHLGQALNGVSRSAYTRAVAASGPPAPW